MARLDCTPPFPVPDGPHPVVGLVEVVERDGAEFHQIITAEGVTELPASADAGEICRAIDDLRRSRPA